MSALYRPHPNGIPCSLLGQRPGAFNCLLSVVMEEKIFSVRSVPSLPRAPVFRSDPEAFSPPPFKLQYIAIKILFVDICFLSAAKRQRRCCGKGSLPRRWGTSYVVWRPHAIPVVPVTEHAAPTGARLPIFPAHADKEQAMNAAKRRNSVLFSKRFSRMTRRSRKTRCVYTRRTPASGEAPCWRWCAPVRSNRCGN